MNKKTQEADLEEKEKNKDRGAIDNLLGTNVNDMKRQVRMAFFSNCSNMGILKTTNNIDN